MAFMGLFRRRKPLSPMRRVVRVLVWVTLMVVVWARWQMPEPTGRYAGQGFRGEARGGGRWRERPPTPMFRPSAEVPADHYRITIELKREDAEVLGRYRWGWPGRGGGQDRPEVKVTVREGGRVYTDVAMHLKGSAGSFRGLEDKPAMTLNFNKHVKGQKFHGYTKVSLNNSVQDPTYLSEAICRELFREAGVPAPRVEHATVLLNDRDLGLYVVSEGWGKPFLRQHFDDVDGNLYDGGFVQDLDADLEVNSGDAKDSRVDLDRLLEAARTPISEGRWARLNEVLDVDRFLTFAALEVMTCHWDGYCLNRNNYRVFHDRRTGKMVFMPHGLDQTFGTGRSHPHETIRPRMSGVVARSVMSTPEGRKAYMERVAALREKVFLEEKITNRLWELAARLQPTLKAYAPELASWHRDAVADYAERIVARARSIREQLASPEDGGGAVTFDETGRARLGGWRGRVTEPGPGAVGMERGTVDGVKVLGLRMDARGGRGSWRTQVSLEAGQYQFDGKVRVEGMGGGHGVCLRLSGFRVPMRRVSEEEWTTVGFQFSLGDDVSEVELVAEGEGAGGVVWFDEESLRLLRLP